MIQEILLVQSFVEIPPDPPKEILAAFYYPGTLAIQATPLPKNASHAKRAPQVSHSQNRRQQRNKEPSCYTWDGGIHKL